MIIKFDHIALTCKISEWKEVSGKLQGYMPLFAEENVPNLSLKAALMSAWHENHVISLLVSNEGLPIEITAYDTVAKGPQKYLLAEDSIIVRTKALRDSMAFYEDLGFRTLSETEMEKSFLIAPSKLHLQFEEEKEAEESPQQHLPYLDQAGYSCLAFVTNNAEKERTNLIRKGVQVTEVDELPLGQKTMKIFFVYNLLGDVCELIEVK